MGGGPCHEHVTPRPTLNEQLVEQLTVSVAAVVKSREIRVQTSSLIVARD